MGERLRVLAVVTIVLIVGIMIGSAVSQGPSDGGAVDAVANTPTETSSSRWGDRRVRVDVLNAGGIRGVAQGATGALRDAGLDVVDWGNDRQFSDSVSRVVDRVGDTILAREIADVLGITTVLSEPDSNRLVEATVKLGPEWATVQSPGPEDTPLTHWWDLRRYFR